MSTTRITVELLTRLNSLAINSKAAVVKPNELASALARPMNIQAYRPEDATPSRLAAELAYGIIMNHPFADGNKRTAFLAANEYLRDMKTTPFVDASPDSINLASTNNSVLTAIGNAHNQVASGSMNSDGLTAVYAYFLGN